MDIRRRYHLVAPLTSLGLFFFCLYYRFLPKNVLKYPWALTAGLATAVTNVLYNILVATFVFWRPPVWKNESGEFSPFFTTRLKYYRKHNIEPEITQEYMRRINECDPGHF